MIDLSGKVAVVTGSTRGIGAATACMMAGLGAAVVVNGRSPGPPGEHIAHEIRLQGGQALYVPPDLTVEGEPARLAQAARDVLGPVDILVNHAGIFEERRPFLETTWADCERYLAIMVRASMELCQAVIPGMTQLGWGRIVSVASLLWSHPIPGHAPYIVAKGALVGLTRALGAACGPAGITGNVVSPGMTPTPVTLPPPPPPRAPPPRPGEGLRVPRGAPAAPKLGHFGRAITRMVLGHHVHVRL